MNPQRINVFLASRLGISRRRADALVQSGQVHINGATAELGSKVRATDQVLVDGKPVLEPKTVTIMFHKPTGYVSSRRQQGVAPTIYALLPIKYHDLKPAGRLDKDSSGLMLLSNDGQLIYRLTHPSIGKEKKYEVLLDRPLSDHDQKLVEAGLRLDDGVSKLHLAGKDRHWLITMREGRNRQIRRTFDALHYAVVGLHRIQLGEYHLGKLAEGEYQLI